jgi:hypothetical protein
MSIDLGQHTQDRPRIPYHSDHLSQIAVTLATLPSFSHATLNIHCKDGLRCQQNSDSDIGVGRLWLPSQAIGTLRVWSGRIRVRRSTSCQTWSFDGRKKEQHRRRLGQRQMGTEGGGREGTLQRARCWCQECCAETWSWTHVTRGLDVFQLHQ